MPTVSGSGNQEVESQDEVKVFKYEGEEEESEKSSSENLLKEDKSSLITETEEEKSSHVPSSSFASASKSDSRLPPDTPPFGLFGASPWGTDRLGYLSPFAYAYTNGSSAMAAKEMGLGAGSPGSSIFSLYHNGQAHLGQPPPAHMGIAPYQLDPKAGYEGRLPVFPDYSVSVAGLRPPMYPFPTSGQYPYPLTADLTQMASAWFTPSGLMHPHPGLTPPLSHPLVPSPKAELANTSHDNHRHPSLNDQKNSLNNSSEKSQMIETKNGDKKPHIKKPLNAFMLYMKEMRAKVVAECTLKESAAINQILGRKWHALSKEEQAKYYDMARRERQLHMQMYPGWNARDNYGMMKKKKRKKEKTGDGANMKKCRARYGLEQQNQWCKPCSPGASLTAGGLPGVPASLLTAMGTSSGGQVNSGVSLALSSGSMAATAVANAVTAMAGAHLVGPHPHLTSVATCYSPTPTTNLHSVVNLSTNSSNSNNNSGSATNHSNSNNNSSNSSSGSSTSSRDTSSTSSSGSSNRNSTTSNSIGAGGGVSSPAEPTYVNL